MPAQLLPGTVAVLPYSGAQAFDLRDERVSVELLDVFIHVMTSFLEFVERAYHRHGGSMMPVRASRPSLMGLHVLKAEHM